jgi:hypothetical protein
VFVYFVCCIEASSHVIVNESTNYAYHCLKGFSRTTRYPRIVKCYCRTWPGPLNATAGTLCQSLCRFMPGLRPSSPISRLIFLGAANKQKGYLNLITPAATLLRHAMQRGFSCAPSHSDKRRQTLHSKPIKAASPYQKTISGESGP